ncbi:MAG: nucleotidyltransferase family protein [Actinomycetota bacterium]|nr:nucleotidyltransferase family protein [Actinomycetota bacterium]
MILAAGRGTRLGNLGERVPKVLLDVGGEPLLSRHLRFLERHAVRRVVINAHHLADQIEAFIDGYRGPLELVCVREQRLLGTAGGVRNALPHLLPGPFLVLYGDVLVDAPLAPLVAIHRRERALATLAVHEASSAEGKGVVDIDACGRVVGFVEKGDGGEGEARVLINSGVYVVEEELVSSLPEGVRLDFGHDVLPDAVRRGWPVFVHRLPSPVVDVGTPEGLALARRGATPPDGRGVRP